MYRGSFDHASMQLTHHTYLPCHFIENAISHFYRVHIREEFVPYNMSVEGEALMGGQAAIDALIQNTSTALTIEAVLENEHILQLPMRVDSSSDNR